MRQSKKLLQCQDRKTDLPRQKNHRGKNRRNGGRNYCKKSCQGRKKQPARNRKTGGRSCCWKTRYSRNDSQRQMTQKEEIAFRK